MAKVNGPDAGLQVLALETSGLRGSVAALHVQGTDLEVVSRRLLPSHQRSAQSLLPTIRELLQQCDWRPDDVNLIGTTTGPGSFTGLRIGVTVAKTLAYAAGAHLVGVHTLAVLAAAVQPAPRRLWAILDAQRQELFVARFESGWQQQHDTTPETRIMGIDSWMGELCEGDVVAGPPLEKLSAQLPAYVEVADSNVWQPDAEAVGRLAVSAFQRGLAVEPMQLVPQYFRKSAAEEKADARERTKP